MTALSNDELDILGPCIYDVGLDGKLIVELNPDDVPGLVELQTDLFNERSLSQSTCLREHGWNVIVTDPDEEGRVFWELVGDSMENPDFVADADECAG